MHFFDRRVLTINGAIESLLFGDADFSSLNNYSMKTEGILVRLSYISGDES